MTPSSQGMVKQVVRYRWNGSASLLEVLVSVQSRQISECGRLLPGLHQAAEVQATACDTAGNCTTKTLPAVVTAAHQTQEPPLAVSILSVPSTLDNADAVSVTGQARANTSSLRTLTLTADGAAPIYSQN